MHQILIDTRAALDSLAIEGCNCAFVGPGYQHEPPQFWQQRKLVPLK
jgi:hypothetical protein